MRALLTTVLCTSFCLSSVGVAGVEKEVRKIEGAVGFWQRTCDAAGKCPPIPEAIGEKVVVSGEILEPVNHAELGVWQTEVTQGDLTLEFRVFWRRPLPPENPHLIFQHRLTHKVHGPVFECSQFKGVDQPPPFSVGVCAGFIKIGEEIHEFGVSFYKK